MDSPVVVSGTTRTISSGQTSNSLLVLRQGTLEVLSGGKANATQVLGTEVLLGGTDSSGVVSSGGAQVISAGGIADGGIVDFGATLTVSAGGVATGTVLYGTAGVLSGGTILGGVMSSDTTISAGRSVALTVGSNGALTVSGVTSVGFNGSAFTYAVLASGTASGTIVSAGGEIMVHAGGTTSGTVLRSGSGLGASEEVFDAGVAIGTVVNSGTTELLLGSGTVSGTAIMSGGTQTVNMGQAVNDAVVAGGNVSVNGTGVLAWSEAAGVVDSFAATLNGNGTVQQSGQGTLAFAGNLSGFSGTIAINSGTLELTSAGAAGGATIDFALGTAGTLRIDGAASPANTISGLANGGTIDLAGVRFAGSASPTVNGDSVTVAESTAVATLAIAGAASDTLILSDDGNGGTWLVNAAPAPVVGSGAALTVLAGQTSGFVGVDSGGTLTVLAGGTASATTLSGTELVSGGTDSAARVDGGTQTVVSGGLAVDALIGSAGHQVVSLGGTALGGIVQPGGTQVVAAGGVASGTVMLASGSALSGGIISAMMIKAPAGNRMSASETVSGGQSIFATVGSGGALFILGGTATGTTVSGGLLSVSAGGAVFGTVLASGGVESIFGGNTTGATVGSGAEQFVGSGSASDTAVLSGGLQIVWGSALNDTVSSGGTVSNTGMLAFTEVAGATNSFAGTLVGSGALVQSGPGTLALAGTLAGFTGLAIISGGTLELASAGAVGAGQIAFGTGAAATLQIDGPTAPGNAILGFGSGDVIDLPGLRYAGNTTPTISGNTVTVTEAGATERLAIDGAGSGVFTLSADSNGGTRLVTTAPSRTVTPGASATITAGQTSSGVIVLSGGTLIVSGGGTAAGATVFGTEILRGGTDSLGVAGSGGVQVVSSGGQALGFTANSGAKQTVSAGGLLSGGVVGGSLTVLPGAIISSKRITGLAAVSGGQAISATVAGGGELIVGGADATATSGAVAGSAMGTVVSNGGAILVGSGGVTNGTVLQSGAGFPLGGAQEEVIGGVSINTVVSSGAAQQIGDYTTSNGQLVALASGSAVSPVVASGGIQRIYAGTILNDTVLAGGLVLNEGTLAYTSPAGVTQLFAGTAYTSGTPYSAGAIVQSGPGTLALAGDLSTFSGALTISGGTLELTSAGAAGRGAIAFAPGFAGTLQIDGATGPANAISGFAAGDTIDLAGLGFTGIAAPTVSGDTVTVTEGGLIETLLLAGAGNGLFRLYPDAAGGTNLGIACYCPGTLILTDRGEVPVEALAIGDRVTTVTGANEPIRWIGRRSYAGRFLAGKAHLLPIRIWAGALGNGLPQRDLLVSPSHAMFIGGLLIPAGQLVDGTGIVQEQGCRQVDYIHVELAAHGVIFAEGAPSETYLEDDNRGMFHNAAEFAALYGDGDAPGRYCAKRVEDGFALEAVRRRLQRLAA